MDQDFEKVFQSDRFDPKTLNPEGTRNVDEGRSYYRTGSLETGVDGTHEDEGKGLFSGDAAAEDARLRRASTGGEELSQYSGHGRHEFPQTRSFKAKKKKASRHKRPSESARHDLPSIPGGDVDQDPQSDEEDPREDVPGSSLPWKAVGDVPIVDTEHYKDLVEKETEGDKKGGVKFTMGVEEDDEEDRDDDKDKDEDSSRHRQYRRPSHPNRKISKKEEENWKRIGSKVGGMGPHPLTEEDAKNLRDFDIDDIGTHRFEKAAGLGRHKIKKASAQADNEHLLDFGKPEKNVRSIGFGFQKNIDHTPHNLFIEMDELEGTEWVEKARWIKYEEDLEEEAGRWGQPHVSSLTFRSLINVRKTLEQGVMLLDLLETDLPGVVHRVVEQLSVEGLINEDRKPDLLRALNYRHKYVQPHQGNFRFGMRRNLSRQSLQDNNSNMMGMSSIQDKDPNSLTADLESLNGLRSSFRRTGSGFFRRNESSESISLAARNQERNQEILNCLEEGTEGCLTLVGAMNEGDRFVSAFVRLANSIVMQNTIEVNLPMRFIFILLIPKNDYRMDPHEIGRSFSTLMANSAFHNVCYGIEGKRELLHAINVFLDDSVVLPPGDWNKQKLLAMADIMDMRKRKEERKTAALEAEISAGGGEVSCLEKALILPQNDEKKEEEEKIMRNPLERTRMPFGGLIDDIRYRYPKYLSDIKDGINPQCVAAAIFIYFAALSGAIAFGGLMGVKTGNDIGIPETLLMTSVSGVIFALFAGCPIIIVGSTGPLLLYDEALFGFSKSSEIEFLPWRTWIGMWTLVIALVVAALQGSTLVKYFSKFTKDIFASYVCLIFIFEAFLKLVKIFMTHPLLKTDDYCDLLLFEDGNSTFGNASSFANSIIGNNSYSANFTFKVENSKSLPASPNTALLSAILMFGTFFIAYFLRIFRNSHIFGRNVRRALGDFGVPIAIVIMVGVDLAFQDTYTEKLNVPQGLQVTKSGSRDWLIPPTGNQEVLPVWAMFAAFLPAILLYLLLFMETHICELIMLEKTKGEKGVGIHLDIVVLSVINVIAGFIGGPWCCAATVRAVSHASALVVMSSNVIPGESPKMIGLRDQRLTALTVSILVGLSVLMSPILKLVPFAVLFGVFLYMGISGMNGVQFFDRLKLMIMPVKHHPQVSYVKHVKTWRMNLFTVFQGIGLAILWIVKSTPAAIAFPFFVIGMIPLRYSLNLLFTSSELEALDGPQAGKDLSGVKDEDVDFFEAAADLPIVPNSVIPLHRSIMGIVNLPGLKISGKKMKS